MVARPSPSLSEACAMIRQDMEDDVARFDGQPLTGALVAEMHGNLAAAVSALAGIALALEERIDSHRINTPHGGAAS
jgi:hypothetical protein